MLTLDLARMAEDCYADASSPALLGKWERQDKPRRYGNFYSCAYKRTDDSGLVVVAFRGTDDKTDALVDDFLGIGLGLNALVMDVHAAVDWTRHWQTRTKNLWLTGHSLGGAYVQLVGSLLDIPGMTFNAPGVLNLLNQISPNRARSLISGALHALTLGKIAYFVGVDDGAMGAIANYRGQWDPVSRVGVHVGAPLQTVRVSTREPHVHSMLPIIDALSRRMQLSA